MNKSVHVPNMAEELASQSLPFAGAFHDSGNVDQFRDGSVQPILWPPQYKSGTMIYPYAAAKK